MFDRILLLLSYFMCANSEGSGETARIRRLARAFAGRLCDKYHNLMSWLIWLRCTWILTWTQYGIIRSEILIGEQFTIYTVLPPNVTTRLVLLINNLNADCRYIWTASWQNQQNGICAQRRLRSAWASAQSDQSLRSPHEESLGP